MTINVPSSLWWLPCRSHSERKQECFVRKTGNGNMTRSEESITRMTSPGILPDTFILLPSNLCIWKKTPTFVSVFPFISSFLSRLCVAVSLSFARPFAPSKDVLRLSRVTRPYRKLRHMKKDTYICKCLFLYQQLPILPGRFRPSTFGVCELNFRVRHGYGWSSQLSPLFLWEPVLSKPYRRSPEVIRLSRCF